MLSALRRLLFPQCECADPVYIIESDPHNCMVCRKAYQPPQTPHT